jgi:hypothetical protein
MNWFRGFFAASVLTTSCTNAAPPESNMKEIVYRGGLIRFEVPKEWLEEYESDGGGMFYREGKDTGTLRLSIITANAPDVLPKDEDIEILKTTRGVKASDIKRLINGNAVASHIERSEEQGTPITLFWWHVTNIIPPKHVRIANFSYTVLTSKENDVSTQAEVKMLGHSIENALFHPELGQLAH